MERAMNRQKRMEQVVRDMKGIPSDVPTDAIQWDSESYWRNEPVGLVSFTAKRYCRKCQQAWEACWCEQ